MRVLIGVDGSACSIAALDLVASLSWPPSTEMILLAAYHVPIDWTGGVGSTMDWVGDLEDANRDMLDEQLRTLGQRLERQGHTIERAVVRGRAASAIIEAARERRVDLIVTGSRGRGQVQQMLLGSVATEVVADAPCSVLVARRPSVSRVVVATDGSAVARRMPERLESWGVFEGLPAEVVAVSIPDGPIFETAVSLYTLGDERLARRRRELRERYDEAAETMAQALTRIGLVATPHLRAGDPAREIIAVAGERAADLIVIGTRGLGGMDRLLLGSVARNVLTHARCSVLVLRELAEGRDLVPTHGGASHASS